MNNLRLVDDDSQHPRDLARAAVHAYRKRHIARLPDETLNTAPLPAEEKRKRELDYTYRALRFHKLGFWRRIWRRLTCR